MDLSLNLGVFPFAKGEKNQGFASGSHGLAPVDGVPAAFARAESHAAFALDGISSLTDAAGNPVDAAMLAGAFRALVDQLAGGAADTADDAAPAADRVVASEADDFAATLGTPSDGDDPESDQIPHRPEAQVWLVELEIFNRAAGVRAEVPASPAISSRNQATQANETTTGQDEVQSPSAAAIPAVLPEAALPASPIGPVNVATAIGSATDPASRSEAPPAPAASPANSSQVRVVPPSGAGQPTTTEANVRATKAADAEAVTIGDTLPRQRQAASRATAWASEETPKAPATAGTSSASAIQIAGDDARRSALSSPQRRVAQDGLTDDREAGSGSGFTVQRAGVAKPEGATQPVEPGTLNRNAAPGHRSAPEHGRQTERSTGNTQPLQAFISRDTASVSTVPEPVSEERPDQTAKSANPSVARAEDRAAIASGRTTSNESWDSLPQHGRQPEPHQPVARPIAADVQALSLAMTSGAHELLTPRLTPASMSTIVSTPSTAQPMVSENTANQIVQAIRLQVTRGGGEATIKLEPKHFGELSITVRVEQGQVTARLQAESPVVREYLQSHQNLLRESLADQQLTLGKFEVAEPPAESRNGDRRSPEERAFAGDRQPQRRKQSSPQTPFEPFEVVA